MKLCRAIPLLFALALTVACAGPGQVLRARSVSFVPRPNQIIETESLWKDARPLDVLLRRPMGGVDRPIQLRAIHDGTFLSILAIWPDATEDGERRAWIWDQRTRKYYLRESETDSFAIKFRLEGSVAACMMNGEAGVYDLWQWRAGWSHVSGYADDRKLTIALEPLFGNEVTVYPAAKGSTSMIYLSWENDAGRLPYELTNRPIEFSRNQVFGIRAQEPSGSAGDVFAEVVYQKPNYKLELMRSLSTGHADDYQIAGKGPHRFAIAITDGEGGQGHYTSELLSLILE